MAALRIVAKVPLQQLASKLHESQMLLCILQNNIGRGIRNAEENRNTEENRIGRIKTNK